MPRIKASDLITITVFKPANVKVTDINTCLLGERNKGNALTEGVLHIYSYIIKKSLSEREGTFGTQWIQIPLDTLRSFLTRTSSAIIDQLVVGGLLEVRDWAPKEEKVRNWKAPVIMGDRTITGECKAYRIPQALYGTDPLYTHTKLSISKKDKNKIQAVNSKRTELADTWRQYVLDQMADVVIIDTPASRATITQLYANNQVRLNAESFITLFNECAFHDPLVDRFGKRCHAPVVNVPKSIRPHTRFRGELGKPVTEIDIVNSQPAILASITSELIHQLAPECAAAAPLFYAMEGDAGWVDYQAACFTGTVYEELASTYNELYGMDLNTPMTRDGAKKVFYLATYGDYAYMETLNLEAESKKLIQSIIQGKDTEKQEHRVNTARAYQCFKQRFESAHLLFGQIKQLDWKGVNPGDAYTNPCFLAQRIESSLVFTVLVRALVEGGVKRIYTVHDALVVKEEDETQARAIIQTALDKLNLPLLLKNK